MIGQNITNVKTMEPLEFFFLQAIGTTVEEDDDVWEKRR